MTVITLGVRDKARSRTFYEALGWRGTGGAGEEPVFFQAGAMVIVLWDRAQLAADSAVEDGGGWGGITLAHNVGSTFWGGYTSIMIDLDGHPWEIAHNPHWTLTDDGAVRLSD